MEYKKGIFARIELWRGGTKSGKGLYSTDPQLKFQPLTKVVQKVHSQNSTSSHHAKVKVIQITHQGISQKGRAHVWYD